MFWKHMRVKKKSFNNAPVIAPFVRMPTMLHTGINSGIFLLRIFRRKSIVGMHSLELLMGLFTLGTSRIMGSIKSGSTGEGFSRKLFFKSIWLSIIAPGFSHIFVPYDFAFQIIDVTFLTLGRTKCWYESGSTRLSVPPKKELMESFHTRSFDVFCCKHSCLRIFFKKRVRKMMHCRKSVCLNQNTGIVNTQMIKH